MDAWRDGLHLRDGMSDGRWGPSVRRDYSKGFIHGFFSSLRTAPPYSILSKRSSNNSFFT